MSNTTVEVSKDFEVPILVELSNMSEKLESWYAPNSIQAYIICGLGFYLLFFGITTTRISLSLVVTYLISYYIGVIAKTYKTVDESLLENAIAKYAYSLANKINDVIENDLFLMFLFSFFISCLLIFVAGGVKYILGFIGVYIFYSTYIDYFIDDEYIVRVFFFITIALIFMAIMWLFNQSLRLLLVILFSITGSLIFLMSLEYILGLKLGIISMVRQMGHNFDMTVKPEALGFVFTFCLIGVCVQLIFIPSLPYL